MLIIVVEAIFHGNDVVFFCGRISVKHGLVVWIMVDISLHYRLL